MWETLDAAAASLTRDGWRRITPYWWAKTVSGRDIEVELEVEDVEVVPPAV